MKITTIERYIILFSMVLIAFSLIFLSLKGRYQYKDGISHDTWTGKVYVWGTKLIDKSRKEAEAKQQKVDDFQPIEDDFVPLGEPNPFDK